MRKYPAGYLDKIVVCPVCKEKRRQGEMMCGTNTPTCVHCYRKGGGLQK